MTYPAYTQQQLRSKNLQQLKGIYREIGCTAQVKDKRRKNDWMRAIATYQSAQLQKIARPAPDNQAIAQMQLNRYIESQATAMAAPTSKTNAPEELTPREISFYHHEYYAGDKLVAAIDYDDDLTQPWVVVINHEKIFRAATPMMCDRYICTHYKDGTLPVQEQETRTSTGNEIMVKIADACEQYDLELLDDGIYTSNGEKLGEVGCISNNCELRTANCELPWLWYFKRESYAPQKPTFCDSAADAVWLLQIGDELPTANEYLQYHPLEQLSAADLRRLFDAAELVGV